MRLSNNEESVFELRIKGYEFPEIHNHMYDSNWLIVEISVSHPKGEWTSHDPCLLTWELEKLINWFDAVAQNETTQVVIKFIEPHLEFHVVNDDGTRILRIYFEAGFRPAWAALDNGIMHDVWLDFPLSEVNLESSIRSLRKQLSKYPQRAT